jgi:hypothetical protein
MNLTPEQIWTAAGVLLGFQVTSFTWRVSREVEVGKSGDLTWLPVADALNLASMLTTVVGVFVFPILDLADINFSKNAFGLAALLFIGYPFALAGHYEMYNKNTERSYTYFPLQERIVLLIVSVSVIAYLVFVLR